MIPTLISLQVADQVVGLTSSCMHLATDDLAGRVIDKTGQGRLRENYESPDGLTEPDALISYFTIPNHLLIDLWSIKIPKLVGQTVSEQGPGEDEIWTNQDTLPALLKAVHSEFAQVSKIVFHMSDASGMDNAGSGIDLEAVLAGQANTDECQSDTSIAVLNIDDQSLFVDIVSRPKMNGSGNDGQAEVSADALCLEVKPSEAIVWASQKMRILERSRAKTGCAKLLIRGSASGTVERSAKA